MKVFYNSVGTSRCGGTVSLKRKSIRLKNFDYSHTGYYFVTICTKDRKLIFENEKTKDIAEKCWLEIPKHFEDVKLDVYGIMPNHIHGIIIIEPVGNRHACSLQRQYQKLPVIIGSYKSAVSKHCHKNGFRYFKWQKSYYDHIIRNEKKLNHIREYIVNNSLSWNLDAENPENWKYGKKIDIDKYYRNIFEE